MTWAKIIQLFLSIVDRIMGEVHDAEQRKAGRQDNELAHRDATDAARKRSDEVHSRPVGSWNDTVDKL